MTSASISSSDHFVRAVAWIGGDFGLNDGLSRRRVVRAEGGRKRQAMKTDLGIGNVDGRVVGDSRGIQAHAKQ